MKKLIIIVLFVLIFTLIYAQWGLHTNDPALIAGGTGEQVIPKIGIRVEGEIYISRFDNVSGNYDVWLQLLDPAGYQLWADEGILVSDHTAMSWLTDYDLDVDVYGNSIITFQDIRNVTNNIFAYKVDPAGNLLWTADGITLSNDTNIDYGNMSPKVLCTSDGSSYFAWARMGDTSTVRINRVAPQGVKLWGETGITIQSTTENIGWPQMVETDEGILLKYYVDTGPVWAPVRHIYIARINLSGEIEWTIPVSTVGGISAWNQILPFVSDGQGGAIISWHDDRNSDLVNEVYIQRVTFNGVTTMPTNGAMISTDTQNQQYYPKWAVDTTNLRIYAVYKQTTSGQTQDGLNAQMLDYNGNRFWGDTGMVMIPLSSYVASPINAYLSAEGVVMIYEVGTMPSSDQSMHIRAAALDHQGNYLWENDYIDIVTTNSTKVHTAAAAHTEGWYILAWEENYNLYAARFNSNGTTPMFYPAPDLLAAMAIEPDQIELFWNFAYLTYLPDTYTIYMDGSPEAVIDYGESSYIVSGLDPGTYEFYLIANYPGGGDSQPSETVTTTLYGTSADEYLNPLEKILIHPNPAGSYTKISYNLTQPLSTVEISIINIKGQVVYRKVDPDVRAGRNELYLALNNLNGQRIANGIYFLKLKTGDNIICKKIVILR